MGKANRNNRLVYLRTVISDDRFRDILLFSYVSWKTKNYVEATIRGIDLAVASLDPSDAPVFVYVDGLVKTQYKEYKNRLRQLGCPIEKVRGGKDENEPLIRLADAVAGATRDLLEKYADSELKEPFSLAVKRGILVGWKNSVFPEASGPAPYGVYINRAGHDDPTLFRKLENVPAFGHSQKTTLVRGGHPSLLTGQWAVWHTQQFLAAILLLILCSCFKPRVTWQKTTLVRRWATYPTDRWALSIRNSFRLLFTSSVYYIV